MTNFSVERAEVGRFRQSSGRIGHGGGAGLRPLLRHHDRSVTIRALNVNSQAVRVAVSDRGSGISRDKLDKLFEPSRTTKPQGLGLGLTISRSIIEAHDGRLWGENNPDRGATFYFELPVHHPQTEATRQP